MGYWPTLTAPGSPERGGGVFVLRCWSWFVYLGVVTADSGFERTLEATTFQAEETACAKAEEDRRTCSILGTSRPVGWSAKPRGRASGEQAVC
jgi:hypothetical protein